MSNIAAWNPIRNIRRVEEMFDRLFDIPATFRSDYNNVVPVEVYERDAKVFVRAAVPGVLLEDLDVSVEDGVLTIRGETRMEDSSADAKVYYREVSYGKFTRSVRLPDNLDFGSVEAEYRNGILTVSVPYLPDVQPKSVRVDIRAV